MAPLYFPKLIQINKSQCSQWSDFDLCQISADPINISTATDRETKWLRFWSTR